MVSREERAWAAGFFDAEGSASAFAGRHSMRAEVSASQASRTGVPEELRRFQAALGGLGAIYGPFRGSLYYWKSARYEVVFDTAIELWPWLSQPKRDQMLRTLENGMGGSTRKRRAFDRSPLVEVSHDRREELAWAGGFFSGEGSIALFSDSRTRRDYRYGSLYVTQATADGTTPVTLLRLSGALFGLGRVRGPFTRHDPWSKLPQYRWSIRSREGVQAALAAMWPWLGSRVRRKAEETLRTINGQTRRYAERDGRGRWSTHADLRAGPASSNLALSAARRWPSGPAARPGQSSGRSTRPVGTFG